MPCKQAHLKSFISAWHLKVLPRRAATVVRHAVVPATAEEQPSSLPPALENSKNECLLQARIGFGERGRGLFFSPAAPAPADPTGAPAPCSAASANGAPLPQQPQQQGHQRRGQFWRLEPQQPQQQQGEDPALLRVPLGCGLALVTGGGPEWLQRELLSEWQWYQGVQLPEQLAALLEATQRPPALRLAAWLLWVVHMATSREEDGGAEGGGASGGAPPEGPAAASGANPASAAAGTPLAVGAVPPQPPPQPCSAQQHPAPGRRLLLLADYVRHVMPPAGEGGSCLRLGDAEVRRLPEDAQAALRDMRAQVTSYISDLRQAGLDWGLSDATLWWAFDMVASRSFAATAPLPPPAAALPAALSAGSPAPGPSPGAPPPPPPPPRVPAAATDVSLALYVPWACLLNHSPDPNAEFRVDLGRRQFLVEARRRYSFAHVAIAPGSELCISYGADLDNVQLSIKYGFCTAGNANDRLPMPPELAAAAARELRRQALCSAAEQLADGLSRIAEAGGAGCSGGSQEQRRTRVFAALASLLQPVVRSPGSGPQSGTGQAGRDFAGLLSWAESAATDPGCRDLEETASSLPLSVQLPFGASVDALLEERKLLAASLHNLLLTYDSIAAAKD
ncbi:hypothetical protein PLESTB_000222600 [Pleodorina starrii]|uniref:SET domain-containing protein n=1 Tax=Pleodorina starrii TaxID=330485 RepID=A0A9W6EYV4_9CHLO|nr:hypothetical protein PLESTB_000222600 [Pleodorina starrii]GLC75708.1 hypothetical protein PLESTF_001676000 [Pleodorina starrii]